MDQRVTCRLVSRPAVRWSLAAVLASILVLSCSKDSVSPDGDGLLQGSIAVTSSVPGAAITLDGGATGLVTPDTLTSVEAGAHRVGALLAGYYLPVEQVVEVIADSVIYAHFELVQIPVTGSIAVTSSVPGALIRLDGQATGNVTPDTLLGVAAGIHTVSVSLEGYHPPDGQTVTVSANSMATVHFELARILGAIAVTSSAPGASIFLDGIETGSVTPDTLREVSDGTHGVRVELPGYYPPDERTVNVVPGITPSVHFDLVRLPGQIAVTSSPPSALISLDGVSTGRVTPDTLRDVSEGLHYVGVFLSGYWPADEQPAAVVAGGVTGIHFDLVPVSSGGAIIVRAPYAASILLDGVPTGSVTPDTLRSLAPGSYVVTLRLLGFHSDPAEHRVTVAGGDVVVVDFDLLAPKIVVCEHFSNYATIPSPAADAALQQVLLDYEGRALSVNPHVNFPGVGDPYYQFNPGAANARILFNQVSSTPRILVDGVSVPTGPPWEGPIRDAIEAQLTVPAPLAIGVAAELGATEYSARVDVWAVAPNVPANLLLFTWVVERNVVLDPPGPNGQSEHYNVLRHLFPTPAPGTFGGEVLGALAEGDHLTFEYVWRLPGGSVDPSELAIVTFAQESSGRGGRVVQTGVSYWP